MIVGPGLLAEALGLPPPTAEQAAVVAAPLAPALVVAGAGSGKTETMAARVVYLVANRLAEPDQILGLTFTRKAAGELGQRIRSRLRMLSGVDLPGARRASATAEPMIGTYHSFAGRLIAEFGPLAGIDPPTRVLTATDTWQLARSVVGRWDGDLDTDVGPERVTQDVLAISAALADHLAGPEALAAALDELLRVLTSAPPSDRQRGPVHSGLATRVRQLEHRRAVVPLVLAYDEAKRAARAVDFADQMQLAASLVTSTPRVGQVLRERHRVVLLDEYQDTGHAQRIILRAAFGAPDAQVRPWRGHPVTAVGDPVQSIYAWRGASASNLPRFAADFPSADGSTAPVLPLLTSFRNSTRVLDLANAASAAVRAEPVPVGELRHRTGAPAGRVRMALAATVDEENAWLADALAEMWNAGEDPPTIAVLLRRRSDMAAVAGALRSRGLPVEVTGVGGLVDEPAVADVIAMLRMVVDHDAGPAAVRILAGPRWRLGLADLAALDRRGRALEGGGLLPPGGDGVDGGSPGGDGAAGGSPGGDGAAGGDGGSAADRLRAALARGTADERLAGNGLLDAIADPGPPQAYSALGYRRIAALARELRRLRSFLSAPLPDLLAQVERTTGLDVEALLMPDGRAHLDALAQVAAKVAATGATAVELLDYLATAGEREDGLAPGTVSPVPGRVQVLTVHGAKGLEWDVVALPHLCDGVFPGEQQSTWLGDAGRLPPAARADRDDQPELVLPAGADQGALVAALADHVAALGISHRAEERRLFYVALTRSRHTLFLSAHHWGATGSRPRGPGAFFTELADHPAIDPPELWAEPPAADRPNPLLADPRTASWPVDPLGSRRPAIRAGAERVLSALARRGGDAAPPTDAADPHGWRRDVELLLAERAAATAPPVFDVVLPAALSVSSMVELAGDPELLARRLRRPIPGPPAPQARRGTAFHAWLERHFAGDPLLGIDELPGAHDQGAAPDEHLPELIAAFRRSAWAGRNPTAVEVPFVTQVAGLTVRGRIDAVFNDPDGGVTVVDWKTGRPPEGDRAAAASVQLAVYRLAFSRLKDLPLESVRAAFVYVASGVTVNPADLLDEAGLARLVRSSTAGPAVL